MKKVLVLGLGLSGKSAARYLLQKGYLVFGFDQNLKFQELCHQGLQFLDERVPFENYQFDQVVVSPGVPPSDKYYAQAKALNIEIIGEVHLALQFLKNPLIAVTGTNGKTTVTLLIEHVLNQCGIKARALGNVGIPLTSYVGDDNEVLVLELSSYQLETLNLKCFDAAVILNITPDHLDRYRGFQEYALQKIKLKECLKENKMLYVNERVAAEFQSFFDMSKIKQFGCDLDHEVENLRAAYAMVKEFNISEEAFLKASLSFKKPKHRIEFVRTVKGVNYYDDSNQT